MPTQMGCDAYRGHFPKRDNAAVWALRQAGAVILGKTAMAELGGSHPGPTRNPFDLERMPGGSSSSSAAAVAACMVPAAIGTQVGGSRPWHRPLTGFSGAMYQPPTRARWVGRTAGADALFHPLLNLGEGGAGTLFVELAPRRPTHADRADRIAADHDRDAPDRIRDIGQRCLWDRRRGVFAHPVGDGFCAIFFPRQR